MNQELLTSILNQVLAIVVPLVVTALVGLVVSGARWVWAQASLLFQKIKARQPKLGAILEEAALFGVTAMQQVQIAIRKDPNLQAEIEATAAGVRGYLKSNAVNAAARFLEVNGVKGVELNLIADAVEQALFDYFNDPALPKNQPAVPELPE